MEKNNEAGSLLPIEFKNADNRSIRTVMVADEPMFVAKDVFEMLDISWEGVKSLVQIPKEWRGVGKLPTPSGVQTFTTINEAAVFKIAFRSNKPEADKFTNWVAGEVLPAIHKTGRYEMASTERPMMVLSQKFYNYATELRKLGLSLRSGSFHKRIRKYPQHFILSGENGQWLITEEFLLVIRKAKQLRDAREKIQQAETVTKYVVPALRPHMQLSLFEENENAEILIEAFKIAKNKTGGAAL